MTPLKKYIIPGCLLLPMISHWLLPWGTELKLYINILGISFYVPDLLYAIYIQNYLTRKSTRSLPSVRKGLIIVLCIAIALYSWIIVGFRAIPHANCLLINNLSFVWLSLIFMLAPLTPKQIDATKPFLITALVILIGEVMLYSIGILHYTTDSHSQLAGQDFNGIMRISTTIGAPTGTAIIIGLLGAINLTLYRWNSKIELGIAIFTSLGVFFTMSRGTSIVWSIFLLYFYYVKYFRYLKLSKRLRSLFMLAGALSVFYYLGGFDPIINRTEHMNKSGDSTAGRESKFERSMQMMSESQPWGYGLGQVLPEKVIEKDYDPIHHFAPHNAYCLIGIELGWPGLIPFLALFLTLLIGMKSKAPLTVYIWLIFLINANTESVILDSEFAALILFAIMAMTNFKSVKNNYKDEPHFIYN